MLVVAGLDDSAVHTPGPDTAFILVVPGRQKLWSGPALGLAVTVTAIVSVHPPDVHMKLYMPARENPLMTVFGDEGESISAVAGLVGNAVHVPIPVAAIVLVEYWQIVWSGPALGLAITITLAVSLHPFSVQI